MDDLVQECLGKIESIIEGKCVRKIDAGTVVKELNELTPLLRVIMSKWVPEVIYTLLILGSASFNELRRTLNVSSRVLSDKLRVLEEKGIVTRRIDTRSKPPRVYYGLTRLGREFGLALIPVLLTIKRAIVTQLTFPI